VFTLYKDKYQNSLLLIHDNFITLTTESNRFLPDSGRTNNVSLYLQEVLWGRGEGKRVKKRKKEYVSL